MPHPEYDLKSVQTPRLAGGLLALFVSLLENRLTRPLLLGQLLKNSGIHALRALLIPDPPTFQPDPPRLANVAAPAGLAALEIPDTPAAHPDGFSFPTSLDFTRAYQEGRLTPLQVAERLLAASQPDQLHLFIAQDVADLLAQARAASERYQQGHPLGPLDGVPVAVKDELDMTPYPTTVGTRFLGRQPATQDATVVARLRAAGALLIGKTNMHEIGIGVTGHNPHHGITRNPYAPDHHTGGSSSGSAAALAAGLCPLAVGADGGGSIRLPAALCGVFGLKPTYGRVSEYGAAPLDWSVAHLGPLAASARDCALGYAIMAGPDPLDERSIHQPALHLEQLALEDLQDLYLGVYWPWFRHAAPEVVAACEAQLERFVAAGARIVDIRLPELHAAHVAHMVTIASEMNAALAQYYANHRRDYSLEVRLDLVLARSLSPADYIQAQRVRTRLVRHFEQAFEQVNAILTPASAIAAPPVQADALRSGESDMQTLSEIMRFTPFANLTGHPAIAFPVGYTQAGLPVGMQAIGRYWHEHLLLRLAHAAERSLPRRKPVVFYELLGE